METLMNEMDPAVESRKDIVGMFKKKLPELPEDTCNLILEQFEWNLNLAFESMGITLYEGVKGKTFESDCPIASAQMSALESKSDEWKVQNPKNKTKKNKKSEISTEMFSERFVTSKKHSTVEKHSSLIRKYPVLVKAAGGYRNRGQASGVRESQNSTPELTASPKALCLSDFMPAGMLNPNPAPELSNTNEREKQSIQNCEIDPSLGELKMARQYLQRIFPSQPLELLEEYWQTCGGDLNYCCDLLLEGGYGEPAKGSPPEQSKIDRSHSNSPENLDDLGAAGGVDLSGTSSTYTTSGENSPKSTNSDNGANNMSFAPCGKLKEELCVPINGDDWLDLQLPSAFVGNLIEKYSNPISGTDLAALPETFLKIKVPPKIAFKLFQLLSLNVMQNVCFGMTDYEVQQQIEADAKYATFIAQHDVDNVDFEPTLLKISDLEVKGKDTQLNKAKECRDQTHVTFASILKLHKLQSTFPGLSKNIVKEYLSNANENFDAALERLKACYPSNFYPPGLSEAFELKEEFRQTIDKQLETLQLMRQDYSPEPEEITGPDWRELSMKHYKLRQEYQEKVQAASQQNMPSEVVGHYASMSAMHNQKMKYANARAKEWYLMYFNQDGVTNKLDLHCQTTKDALNLLHAFLGDRFEDMKRMNKRKAQVQIVTGRGNNSVDGVARLHPAVKEYLTKRNLRYSEDVGQFFVYLTRE